MLLDSFINIDIYNPSIFILYVHAKKRPLSEFLNDLPGLRKKQIFSQDIQTGWSRNTSEMFGPSHVYPL